MKFGLLTLVLLLSATCSYAQTDTVRLKNKGPESTNKIVTDRAPQAVYFGLGGSGPLFSINYDRRFGKRLNGLGFAAGLGFFGGSGAAAFSVPVSVNYLLGRKNHFVELAAGATYLTAGSEVFDADASLVFGHFNLGYRFQDAGGGFFVRTGMSPLIEFELGEYVTSFYLGLGYTF